MQHKLSERWSSKEVTSIKSKMVRKLFKVLTDLEIIACLYRENNKNNKDKLNNELINWNQNSNKNNFIDFIFDMKISVPKQSIQWQMKQNNIKVK